MSAVPLLRKLPCETNSDLSVQKIGVQVMVFLQLTFGTLEYLKDSLDRDSQRPWYTHVIFMARAHVGFEQ